MGVGALKRLAVPWPPLDVAIVVVLAAATETLAWVGGVIGDHIAGPRPVAVGLPLLLAVPLLWRRTRPLLSWALVAAGICGQALASRHSAEGLEVVAALIIGPYSVAAYSDRRRGLIGLAVVFGTYAIYAGEDANFRSGRANELWATAFFGLVAIASWLAGAGVRGRRETRATAARAARLESDAEEAVAAERGRVARELHDIVSHNLSVVVLQAAGARAQLEQAPSDVGDTLEKIERSGREALVEMRRMLGLLRGAGEDTSLAPQPGLSQLPDLAAAVRNAGLPVTLDVSAGGVDVLPVVALSTYRIVQEALTNSLKHAHATHSIVRIGRDAEGLVIDVIDDGCGPEVDRPDRPGASGHGLSGMRERVALLGGELHTGRGVGGGFLVHARLPLARREP